MMWAKDGKSTWVNSSGVFIVKDTIIGYLVFESRDYFYGGGLDFKSFDKLKDAKEYGDKLWITNQ